MKRLTVLLMATVFVCACAKKEGSSEGGNKKSDWPTGVTVAFSPEDRIVKHDKKLKMWVELKTDVDYSFEWLSEGKCGELQFDPAKAFEATLIGGQLGADCNEKVTLKVMGPKGSYEKQFGIKVEGSDQFKELTVRYETLPENWTMINDYDKTLSGREMKCVTRIGGEGKPSMGLAVDESKKRKKSKEEEELEAKARAANKEQVIVDYYDGIMLNLLGAPFGEWNFEFANCSFGDPPEGEKGVLAFRYDLPHHDDYCGYFENLKLGEDCETEPFDTSKYTHLTFIAKSGDDKTHRFHAEMVNWEQFAEFHQGRPEVVGPFDAGAEWKRFEVELPKFYKDTLNAGTIKSISFKIKRESNFPDNGVILFDNVAFINNEEN